MNVLSKLLNRFHHSQKKEARETIMDKKNSESDFEWFDSFNISLGMDLGGAFHVLNAFEDPAKLLGHFTEILAIDREAVHRGNSPIERSKEIALRINRYEGSEKLLLARYWDFFSDAFSRVHRNPNFVTWIKGENTFTVMPHIFSFEILKIVCRISGK